MLPYFRSMEAFFDLSLPKSWADLSDTQLLFFFRQLATDKPAPPIGEVLRTAMNAQIRALTGGDITKEEAVLSMDTSQLRFLLEPDGLDDPSVLPHP